MAAAKPNVLFIMTDHQRADSLGMVQAGVEVTPNLNRLAAQSVRFTRAYNACPLCAPARTALATGVYPTRNGIVYNDWRGERARDFAPMHQCLDEAGYDVAHLGVHHVRVRPGLQERVDFKKWVSNAEYGRYEAAHGIDESEFNASPLRYKELIENQGGERVPTNYSNAVATVWPHPPEHFYDSYLCREAVEFIGSGHSSPFAMFLALWAPHPPLRVPEPYASMFDPEALDLPGNVGMPAEGEPPGRRLSAAAQLGEGVTMDQWRRAWAAHLGLVRLADDGIGTVLEALEDSGMADSTIVVFTVDHGDHLGQHRMYQKMDMYEQAVRIPLLFSVPGAQPRTFDAPVSHLDVMPTLLELTGARAPDGLDGLSLAECITAGAPPVERPVFSQFSGNPTFGDTRRAVITRRYKYVYDPADEAELYDLEDDPLEMHNRASDPALSGVRRELHQTCKDWHEAHGDWVEF